MAYKGRTVIEESRAGLQMDNRVWEMALGVRDLKQPVCWMDNLEADSVSRTEMTDSEWHPLYGERYATFTMRPRFISRRKTGRNTG